MLFYLVLFFSFLLCIQTNYIEDCVRNKDIESLSEILTHVNSDEELSNDFTNALNTIPSHDAQDLITTILDNMLQKHKYLNILHCMRWILQNLDAGNMKLDIQEKWLEIHTKGLENVLQNKVQSYVHTNEMDKLTQSIINYADSSHSTIPGINILIKAWLHALVLNADSLPFGKRTEYAKNCINYVLTDLFRKKQFKLIKIIIPEIMVARSTSVVFAHSLQNCKRVTNNILKAENVISVIPDWVSMNRMNEISDLLVTELGAKRRTNAIEMIDYEFITQTLMDTLLKIRDFGERLSKTLHLLTSILSSKGSISQVIYIFDDILNATKVCAVLVEGSALQIAFVSIRTVIISIDADHHICNLYTKLVDVWIMISNQLKQMCLRDVQSVEIWKYLVRLNIMTIADLSAIARPHRQNLHHKYLMLEIEHWSTVFFNGTQHIYDLSLFDNIYYTQNLLYYLTLYQKPGHPLLDIRNTNNTFITTDGKRYCIDQFASIYNIFLHNIYGTNIIEGVVHSPY